MADKQPIRKLNLATETVQGSQGSAFIEIDNRRYVLGNLTKFKASFKTNTIKKGVLGEAGKKVRSGGWEGTWDASLYYNQTTLRELAIIYARDGYMPPVNIQIINEDPASAKTIGRQSVIFKECVPEEMIIAMLDVDAEVLEEDISGTFNDVEFSEKFVALPNA